MERYLGLVRLGKIVGMKVGKAGRMGKASVCVCVCVVLWRMLREDVNFLLIEKYDE